MWRAPSHPGPAHCRQQVSNTHTTNAGVKYTHTINAGVKHSHNLCRCQALTRLMQVSSTHTIDAGVKHSHILWCIPATSVAHACNLICMHAYRHNAGASTYTIYGAYPQLLLHMNAIYVARMHRVIQNQISIVHHLGIAAGGGLAELLYTCTTQNWCGGQ